MTTIPNDLHELFCTCINCTMKRQHKMVEQIIKILDNAGIEDIEK